MKLEQALPILKEFGYHERIINGVFLVRYSYENFHICQMLFVDVVKSLKNQQQLRDTVSMIYKNCIIKIKDVVGYVDENKVIPTTLKEDDPADWWKK